MRKSKIGIIMTSFFLISYFISIYLFANLIQNKWLSFGIGVGILVISIIAVIILSIQDTNIKKWLSSLIIILNGVGTGLMVVSLMLHFKFDIESLEFLGNIAISLFICIGTYILYLIFMNIKFFSNHLKIYTALYFIFMIALAIIMSIFTDFGLYVIFAYFMMAFMMVPLIIIAVDEAQAWRNFAFASIGAFALITIIVLVILLEADDLPIDIGEISHTSVENPNKRKYKSMMEL